MADKEGMERKVYLLPAELAERIKAYQTAQGIVSEVEAVRRLLDSALQMRDTAKDILFKLSARFEEEKDFRELAKSVLAGHALVTEIYLDDNDLTFRIRSGDYGSISSSGTLAAGDDRQYMREVLPPSRPRANVSPRQPARDTPSWVSPKGASDLDDEIPF
jgi:hypothetical protein